MAALLLFFEDPHATGIKALNEERYEAAAVAFGEAAKADPKDYGAHFHLALAQSMLNRNAEAIASYRKVLELKPGLYEAQLNLGMVLLRERRSSEAIAPLSAAVQQKPREFRPVFYLAEAHTGAGEPEQAAKFYRIAIEIDPKSAGSELGLARALAAQGNLVEGAVHYRRAAELDASFKDALLDLAAQYEKTGRPKEAAEIYSQFPENPAARERLGELLLETGDALKAIPELEAAVKASPTPANRYALATAYVTSKQLEKAIPLLEDALKSEPANADLRAMYGRALRELRQYPRASEQFLEVVKARPGDAEAWSDLAGMLVLMERYPEALAALDKVRSLGGEKPGHHYLRAIVLDKNQAWVAALESYEKFLEVSEGKYPEEEFKARQRLRVIRKEAGRK